MPMMINGLRKIYFKFKISIAIIKIFKFIMNKLSMNIQAKITVILIKG